jgi:hypothetical protein
MAGDTKAVMDGSAVTQFKGARVHNGNALLGNKSMKCLQSLLTDNAPCDSVGLESCKRGGENAGILHEVQKKG